MSYSDPSCLTLRQHFQRHWALWILKQMRNLADDNLFGWLRVKLYSTIFFYTLVQQLAHGLFPVRGLTVAERRCPCRWYKTSSLRLLSWGSTRMWWSVVISESLCHRGDNWWLAKCWTPFPRDLPQKHPEKRLQFRNIFHLNIPNVDIVNNF